MMRICKWMWIQIGPDRKSTSGMMINGTVVKHRSRTHATRFLHGGGG